MIFNSLLQLVFKKETSPVVKRNVVIICQISFLVIFMIFYNLMQGQFSWALLEIPVVLGMGTIWWMIKKKDTYYSVLMFLLMLPLLQWAGYQSVVALGAAGVLWFYPIVVLFFFCLPERLAWISTVSTLVVAMVASFQMLPQEFAIRLLISLSMIAICCGLIFRSLYTQDKNLEYKRNKDGLTGAYNRTLLKSTLISSVAHAQSTGEHMPSILCVDADNFKQVNDTYGYQAGDDALMALSQCLGDGLLNYDDKLFRIGGEEFLLLLNRLTSEEAASFAEGLVERVSMLSALPDGQSITVSIGVATYKESMIWSDWVKAADDAMYDAKAKGKNRVICTDGMLM